MGQNEVRLTVVYGSEERQEPEPLPVKTERPEAAPPVIQTELIR